MHHPGFCIYLDRSLQSLLLFSHSVVSRLFVIPWTTARQASLSFTISWSLLKLMSIESVMPSNHLILWTLMLGKIEGKRRRGQQKMRWLELHAAAKSLQSCPTLCDPTDGSPPGSPVPGILQARTLEWVAISFSKFKIKVCIVFRHFPVVVQ